MKKILALIGVVGSLSLAPAANATFVYNWTAHATASFDQANTKFTSSSSNNHKGDHSISWGTTSGTQSSLNLFNFDTTQAITTNGAAIITQGLTHNNNVVSGATLKSTVLNTYLSLKPSGGSAFDEGLDLYQISFKETTNNANQKGKTATQSCGFDSVSYCDDIFTLTGGSLNTGFDYAGFHYIITASEINNKLGFLTASQCEAAGYAVGVPCYGFVTQEGQNTSIQFKFDITGTPPKDVPEPAPLALLSLGMLTMFSIRSRKNS
jgi:hypothetical protein